MLDKLTKLNKKKTKGLDVIKALCIEQIFYDWIKSYDPLLEKIYSLKRLANIFLSYYPSYYCEYEKKCNSLNEEIRIAQTCVYED